VPELDSLGSVRGALRNERPYREHDGLYRNLLLPRRPARCLQKLPPAAGRPVPSLGFEESCGVTVTVYLVVERRDDAGRDRVNCHRNRQDYAKTSYPGHQLRDLTRAVPRH